MKYFLPVLLMGLGLSLTAQPTNVGLVAYYGMDGNVNDLTGNTGNAGTTVGDPVFECGVDGEALQLDGVDDQVIFQGSDINSEFNTEDFTLSFYFKQVSSGGTQYLISKRPDTSSCPEMNVFYVRYITVSRSVNCVLLEEGAKGVSLVAQVPENTCWNHVVVIRRAERVQMFVNGVPTVPQLTSSRIDLSNDGRLLLGTSNCLRANELPFDGLIDEMRLYNRALDDREVLDLFFRPDQILTPDTLLFLGNSVDIRINAGCATDFSWEPSANVFNADEGEPTITPIEAGREVYYLNMADDISPCVAFDSIQITVVDPNDLDCDEVFLPDVFTPNGDGINDTYGISNPFALQDFISFEIFDRWGGRVFSAETPFDQWDGRADNQRVNPGVMLYRVRYRCDGEEKLVSGSVTIMR